MYNIKKAVEIINGLDDGKFSKILLRIVQNLHVKDSRTFSIDEVDKLAIMFDTSKDDIELVISACEFIFQQAAYHSAKPGALESQLRSIGLVDDKVVTLVEVWAGGSKEVTEQLRRTHLYPNQLDSVNWKLNLQLGQKSCSKMKAANAQLEFNVTKEDQQEKEKIQVEFSHEELYEFYNQLEQIQSQLDSLS